MKPSETWHLPHVLRTRCEASGTIDAVTVSAELAEKLERGGNRSSDWSRVRVHPDTKPEDIHGCELERCVLGPGVTLHASRIVDSTIDRGARLTNCSLVQGYIIGPDSVIESSRLEHSGSTTFGNDIEIALGNELASQKTPIYAELSCDYLCDEAKNRSAIILAENEALRAQNYRSAMTSDHAIVGAGARIFSVSTLRSSFIDDGVLLEGASLIEYSTFRCDSDTGDTNSGPSRRLSAGHGVIVRSSHLQAGASVLDQARVVRSLLGRDVAVGSGASVSESVLCRRSEIARGEVTNSLVGPLVNMHHEGLLIATVWPRGRGNVGSGAQVGSNHTSRLPDQALLVGEGVFFGLATAVKFPANYAQSPYSVIATGLITGPQRVSFPFSLLSILDDAPADAPSGYNRLIPGWMFSHNLFAILRDERKFASRLGVSTQETSALSDEIIGHVRSALDRLEAVTEPVEWYDEGRIEGVGKNVLLEVDRKRGISAYRDLIAYYELRRTLSNGTVPDGDRLDEYSDLLHRLKIRARDSRARDFHRGRRVFDDYSLSHPAPEADKELIGVLSTIESEQELLERIARG